MECARLWKNDQIAGVELLKASFQRFEFAKHWHDELAVGIIEKGAEGLNYLGQNLVIPERHIVAINPAEIHTGFAGCATGWRYRMFYFDVGLMTELLGEPGKTFSAAISEPVIHDPQLYTQLKQLHLALELPSLTLSKESLLLLTLTGLFARHGVSRMADDKPNMADTDSMLVRDYLSDNWRDNVSLDTLASLCGRSKYRLIRNFKAHYGLTPHQFLLLLKVNKAKHLLALGWHSADVALETGFFDQSHMVRNFKRAFGVPPSCYLA